MNSYINFQLVKILEMNLNQAQGNDFFKSWVEVKGITYYGTKASQKFQLYSEQCWFLLLRKEQKIVILPLKFTNKSFSSAIDKATNFGKSILFKNISKIWNNKHFLNIALQNEENYYCVDLSCIQKALTWKLLLLQVLVDCQYRHLTKQDIISVAQFPICIQEILQHDQMTNDSDQSFPLKDKKQTLKFLNEFSRNKVGLAKQIFHQKHQKKMLSDKVEMLSDEVERMKRLLIKKQEQAEGIKTQYSHMKEENRELYKKLRIYQQKDSNNN